MPASTLRARGGLIPTAGLVGMTLSSTAARNAIWTKLRRVRIVDAARPRFCSADTHAWTWEGFTFPIGSFAQETLCTAV